MNENSVNSLDNLIAEAAAARAAETAAVSADEAATAAFLTDLARKLRPVLPAISRRLLNSSYESAGRNGCNPVRRYKRLCNGVVLADGFDREGDGSGNRGTFNGERLILRSDGVYLEQRRSGTWSHWQGEADEWESTHVRELSPAQVAAEWDVDAADVLALVSKALAEGRDTSAARAKALEERAARVTRAREAFKS